MLGRTEPSDGMAKPKIAPMIRPTQMRGTNPNEFHFSHMPMANPSHNTCVAPCYRMNRGRWKAFPFSATVLVTCYIRDAFTWLEKR